MTPIKKNQPNRSSDDRTHNMVIDFFKCIDYYPYFTLRFEDGTPRLLDKSRRKPRRRKIVNHY